MSKEFQTSKAENEVQVELCPLGHLACLKGTDKYWTCLFRLLHLT